MQKNDDDAPGYPRVYHVGGTVKLVFNGLGILMSAFAITIVCTMLGRKQLSSGGLFLVAFFAGFALWFLYLASQRIILSRDAIERVTWSSRRMLKREDIRGWYGKSYWGYTYILVPRESRGASMRLPPLWRWDKAFFEWMKEIPHLKG
jgi:hypothetical protein